jgi:predicted metal-dependent hydrolase
MSMELRQIRDIQYRLLPGTDRRTTDIVIERDGTICVRPPSSLTLEQIDQTVLRKRLWIYRNLAEWRDLNAARVVREWVSGESCLYLGSSYRLELVTEQTEALKLKDGRFHLRRDVVDAAGAQAAHEAFRTFYSDKGQQRLLQRVPFFAARVGVSPGTVAVRDLGFRWAACMPSNELHFHWKCFMAPLKVIDYIVVHELCHLLHRDHCTAFWDELDKVMPDWMERKEWLRLRGASFEL